MNAHARLSPSGASRWMKCPGSVVLEDGYPDTSSTYADEGTAAHELAAMALESQHDARAYLGRVITVNGTDFTVDDAMVEAVQVYLDNVREYAIDGELLIEQCLSISHITSEPDAHGTSDAVIIKGNELQVHDLKYGRGVKVDAENNEQLMIYALAALEQFSMLQDFERVVMVIHQPRLQHISEWSCSVEDLLAFGRMAGGIAEQALDLTEFGALNALNPGEIQCRWCKAKATCPALAREVRETVTATATPDDFADLDVAKPGAEHTPDQLAAAMAKVDLIESWCTAVRAETERRLLAGDEVPGYKLVQGRRGARAWTSSTEAEATLKSMRLKIEEMYDLKLISPTTAEKLHKAGTIGPRQWPRLQDYITQSEGKPSVAPASDKRPALQITAVVDEFEDIAEESLV